MAIDNNQIFVALNKLFDKYSENQPLAIRRIMCMVDGLQQAVAGPAAAKREIVYLLPQAKPSDIDAFLQAMAQAIEDAPSGNGTTKADLKQSMSGYLNTLSRL